MTLHIHIPKSVVAKNILNFKDKSLVRHELE